MIDSSSRINKYIALHAGLSRREADEYLVAGRVTINDQLAKIGAQVHSGDTVAIDGIALQPISKVTYLLLNKPAGYVCSRRRQGVTPTVYELLPEEYHSLKLVGRLDKDSSGLIFLTNDGDFAHRMTHPVSYTHLDVYKRQKLSHPYIT